MTDDVTGETGFFGLEAPDELLDALATPNRCCGCGVCDADACCCGTSTESQKEVHDIRGRTISAGDTVCYPVRQGSHMRLVVSTVTDVAGGSIGVEGTGRWTKRKYRARITRLDRVVRL